MQCIEVIEMHSEVVLKTLQCTSLKILKRYFQVQQSNIHDYLKENVWKSFLRCFFKAIDEEATFTTEFKKHSRHLCQNVL
ncbi:hypothetical protein F8M41_025949 [Gigaspora margarita]|uniref:Uncharacterized protein n=1 Tax=Gigaspora margarita TaxID=4874 RepID=A0A8H4ESW2_GIGMA|nr:hypothetical protein F8M41_025949 [Gigaspora margarita]